MSQEDIAMGFVHWVGTFGSLSKRVSNLSDLTDGIALFEICAEIDRQWFKSIRSADIGDNWVLKMNNLKKLYKLVTRYYEEVLGYPTSNLAEPNLAAIAKNEEADELLKLCHLILTLAVQCERNQVYIGKIMSLGEEDQRSLMVSIESVLAQLGSAEPDGEADGHDIDMDDASRSSDGADPVARLQAELMKSYAEKDELEKSAHELTVEHRQVQNKYEELLVLNEELKMRMDDLEKSMAKADKSGRADFLLRAEIENLKHDLEKADIRSQEADKIHREQTATISDLSRKLGETADAKDEAVRLRDQLQEYKHAAERLAKSEHVIEKYKKKLEESTDLRRQVRLLEEQLAQAQDRSQQIEDEFRRVAQRRPAMDNYRDEYAQLEARHNQATSELALAAEQLRKLEDEKERLHQDKQRDQELILSLEESLRELELHGAGGAAQVSGTTLESGLASAMEGDDRTALLAKIARLERELGEARSGTTQASSTSATDFLEEIADTASRERDDAVRELRQEQELRKRLEVDVAAYSERLVASSADVSNAHSQLAQAKEELERARASSVASEQERKAACEAANLRKENSSLEGWYAETHEQSKEFKAEIDRLSAENNRLTQRLSALQEEATRLDVSKREAEANNKHLGLMLERQKAAQFSPSDIDRLQKELVKSRDEVHALQVSLKRTKDHCIQLDQKLEQTRRDGTAPQENYREVILSLQSQLAMKDEQLDSMSAMLREQNTVHLLESRTMASAWFNLQRQLERQSGFGHSSGMGSAASSSRQGAAPASWLGQQRVTLDMQLTG
ncbi:hypothetical protein GGI01_002387 [Coemansia sp. RSA 376]|nr:hypothetical protein GGI01_002387 [Coemansia sp. RSA 376]